MSAGMACQIHDREWWYVIARRVNHSAFSGYRATPSAYSEVVCGHPSPVHRKTGAAYEGSRWRTKAAYVNTLPDEHEWTPPQWAKQEPIAGGHDDVWLCLAPLCGASVREAGRGAHDRDFHPERE